MTNEKQPYTGAKMGAGANDARAPYDAPNARTDPAGVSEEEAENTDDTMRVATEDTAGPAPKSRTTEEVRQGHTGDHLRYILMFSFTGIVIVFGILILFYVL